MIYDRQITIAVAPNRKSTDWVNTTLSVSELYDRLSAPIRSTETLDAYMKLTKAKQDDLKDVGGFVGGTLKGARRKAENVTGRDIVTLDFDNVPAGRPI